MAQESIVTTLAGDKSVRALAARLVTEKLVAKPADQAALENAILAANPHLHDIAKLPTGTPIVIPSAPAPPKSTTDGDRLVSGVRGNIAKMMADGRAIFASGADFAKAKEAALQSPEAQKAIGDLRAKDGALADKVSAAAEASKATVTAISAAAAKRDASLVLVEQRLVETTKASRIT